MARPVRELGPLERAIMEYIWDRGEEVSVRDVVDAMTSRRRIAYTTVMTVMNRLSSKGMLRRRRSSRAHLYRPTRSREQYGADLVRAVVTRAGDRRSVLLGFVRSAGEDELKELRGIVEDVERERGR